MSSWTSEEEKYRLLVDAVADYAIYMVDPDGVVASWNSGARRLKGYEADEIIGRHFSLFYKAEDRDAGLPALALRTAAAEGRFEREGWRVRKDGRAFWAHVIIDAIRDDRGRLIGFAKVTRDLTERKAAEDALKLSEERFRLLVQGVADYAIFMLDPEGYVTNWNLGAERIKGYAPDEIVGRHFSCFYTEEDRAAGLPQRALDTALKEGRFEREGWRVRRDGAPFWANVVIDRICDGDGELLGYAKITRDISERRKAQLLLEKTREAFFQAQKMEAVGQLTGGIAHDFNNLLMAVLGGLEILRKRVPFEGRDARIVENVTEAAKRGASLTQRLLSFARRQELSLEPVDLRALVRGMRQLLEQPLEKRVRIELRLPDDLPHVIADANQLELALLNLVVNARDAMPKGGEIIVEARPATVAADGEDMPRGDYVRLSVTDDGEGMDPETLARAAEPFFTTKGVGKGTGLGLSMVHGTAEQCGGRLLLRSVKGEGSTAELWLPAASARQAAPAVVESVPGVEPETAPTILVVDDDTLVLGSTSAMLEDLGYGVRPAGSAAEALEAIRQGERFDLVVTDQVMPDMTGLELAKRIRAGGGDLPIILATGYAELPREGGLELPRLAKPFSQDELKAAIVRVLAAP